MRIVNCQGRIFKFNRIYNNLDYDLEELARVHRTRTVNSSPNGLMGIKKRNQKLKEQYQVQRVEFMA